MTNTEFHNCSELTGRLFRIGDDGLGYIEEPETKRCYSFTFDQVHGYHGQSAKTMGLTNGRTVRFQLTASGGVRSVSL